MIDPVVQVGRSRGHLLLVVLLTEMVVVVACGSCGRDGRQWAQAADFIAENATDGADRGDVVLVADALGEQLVPNLPGKDAGVFDLEVLNKVHHLGSSDTGLGTTDGTCKEKKLEIYFCVHGHPDARTM